MMRTIDALRTPRRSTLVLALLGLALLTAPVFAPTARAQGKEGEIWVGYYQPDPPSMDNDISFGLRSLFRAPDGLGFGVEIGYVSVSGEATSGAVTGSLDWDAFFFDGIFDLPIGHSKKAAPSFFFGTGLAFANVDSSVEGRVGSIEADDLDGTSLTVQAGFDLKLTLGDHFYLRPAARVRWFEARGGEDLDTEYVLGFGRSF
jgi:hypothetical protein